MYSLTQCRGTYCGRHAIGHGLLCFHCQFIIQVSHSQHHQFFAGGSTIYGSTQSFTTARQWHYNHSTESDHMQSKFQLAQSFKRQFWLLADHIITLQCQTKTELKDGYCPPKNQEIPQNTFKMYNPEQICLSKLPHKYFYNCFLLKWIKDADMLPKKKKNPGVTESQKT